MPRRPRHATQFSFIITFTLLLPCLFPMSVYCRPPSRRAMWRPPPRTHYDSLYGVIIWKSLPGSEGRPPLVTRCLQPYSAWMSSDKTQPALSLRLLSDGCTSTLPLLILIFINNYKGCHDVVVTSIYNWVSVKKNQNCSYCKPLGSKWRIKNHFHKGSANKVNVLFFNFFVVVMT